MSLSEKRDADTFADKIVAIHGKFAFYDVIPHLIYLADEQGRIVHVNKDFADFSKKAEDDLQDDTEEGWLRNVHPDDVPHTLQLWQKALKQGTPYENVYRLLDKYGEYKWFITRARKTDMFGKEYAWVGTCTDISEQMKLSVNLKKTSDTLYEQKELLSTILKQLPVAVIVGEYPTGKIILANQMMEDIGKRPVTMSKSTMDYAKDWVGFHPDGRKYDPEEWPLSRSLFNREQVTGEIIEIMKGDGTRGLISMNSSPVLDKKGDIMAGIAIMQDIQDKVVLQKEKLEALNAAQAAMEANKLKSAFLANMSHDIRTPMNGVIGCTTLLQDTPLSQEQKEYLDIIVDCGRVLLSLINDILDLSKIEAGRMELEYIPFSLDVMADGLLQIIRASLISTGKSLHVKLEKKDLPSFVNGDRKRTEQVITNLLSNAIKFTPDDGYVWVRLHCRPLDKEDANGRDRVMFRCEVQDTGIGIKKEVQKQLFSAFVQADVSTTRKFGGTGLGLSICKDIVTLMNGRIWLESEYGKGSTFAFEIPLEIVPSDEIPKEVKHVYVANREERKQSRVLLAEDNKVNGYVAIKVLKNEGYVQVDWAKNGLEAVSMFMDARKPYDIVLMDCQMPIMDGFEASRNLRNKGVTVPILAFTASVTPEERIKCLQSGMNDVVMKPFDKNVLTEKMDTFIKEAKSTS